jgi:pSer/pThr/pTyr-binding forkhead associated (FHA) protein
MLPLVVTVESPNGQTRRYAFADSPVRVGRSPFAELQLTEAFISRWEGTLRFDEQEVSYFHVSQTNPTYVDGRLAGVHEEVPIGPTTVLTLGELKLRFVREAVREEDLRRKGKRRPIKSDDEAVAKTVWLDAAKPLGPPKTAEPPPSQYPEPLRPEPTPPTPHAAGQSYAASNPQEYRTPRSDAPPAQPALRSDPQVPSVRPGPASTPPRNDSVRPTPASSGGVSIAREVRVLGAPKSIATPGHSNAPGNARSEPPRANGRPGVSDQVQSLARPAGGFGGAASDIPAERARPTPASEHVASSSERPVEPRESPRAGAHDVDALHNDYRAGWRALNQAFARALERAPEAQRGELADQFQRRYPQVVYEADFRALLKQYRLEARKPEVAEIGEWLRGIAQGVLPPTFRLDTGLTLERVLSLLEMLTQSFAEINDAQDNIRKHWLGRAARSSVLRSDNGRVILAYLLNPKADWGDRLGELEGAISDVIMHELSLFKATLEGARSLLDSLSPAALAKAEGIELASIEEGTGGGFLGRLLPRDSPESRLWRRFTSTYEGLMDGDRYQRLFLGRSFARTYLAAMGQRDGGEDRKE